MFPYELRYAVCLVGLRTKNNPGKNNFFQKKILFLEIVKSIFRYLKIDFETDGPVP